jgi:hypothetical protein
VLVAGEDLDGVGEGLLAAWDPEYKHLDLRTNISPTLEALFTAVGHPAVCLPIDFACPPGSNEPPIGLGSAALRAAPPGAAPAASVAPPAATTPIDSIVGLIGSSEPTTTTSVAPKRTSSKSSGNLLSRLSRLLVGSLG